jgi:hypothetical protein
MMLPFNVDNLMIICRKDGSDIDVNGVFDGKISVSVLLNKKQPFHQPFLISRFSG